jgi:hypothetical protein
MAFVLSGYTFSGPFDSVDQLNDESGVFVVVTGETGNWKLIDCGEAGNLKQKISNHERKECWMVEAIEGRLAFFVKLCEVKGRQLIAEEILREHEFPCR